MSPRKKRTTKKSNDPTHTQIQTTFVDFIAKKYPKHIKSIIKISNEGKRSWAEGKKQKAEGMCKGAYDIFFAKQNAKYAGLWIEIKSKDDKESAEQSAFGARMIENGYQASVVWTIDSAIMVFEDYISNYLL